MLNTLVQHQPHFNELVLIILSFLTILLSAHQRWYRTMTRVILQKLSRRQLILVSKTNSCLNVQHLMPPPLQINLRREISSVRCTRLHVLIFCSKTWLQRYHNEVYTCVDIQMLAKRVDFYERCQNFRYEILVFSHQYSTAVLHFIRISFQILLVAKRFRKYLIHMALIYALNFINFICPVEVKVNKLYLCNILQVDHFIL